MELFIPPELKSAEPELHRFFEAMIYKLRKNAHKGKWEGANLEGLFERLQEEINELKQAVQEGSMFEVILESADCSNFLMMIAAVALEKKE